ncbi:unnamed protein product [Umbelopsis vinacea]
MDKIGEGTYGIVYKAKHKASNRIVALKKIRLNSHDEGVPATAIREVSLLKELKHENVIRLLDIIHNDTMLYLVFDYLDIDLRKYMDAAGKEGMTKVHVQPQNLLIDKTGRLTIADLGLSRAFGIPMRTYTHEVITLWYRAPEILLGSKHYSTSVDMWSVGCIFAEMVTLRPLFPGDSQIDELFRIFRVLGTPTEEHWKGVTALPDHSSTFPQWKGQELTNVVDYLGPNGTKLWKSLLVYDPAHRISAKAVINEMKETTFSPEYFRHRWLATPASFSDGAGWREKVTNARLESNTREQGQRAKPEDKDHEC